MHKALHRPLTICGVDRRLFFLALLMGAATFERLQVFDFDAMRAFPALIEPLLFYILHP